MRLLTSVFFLLASLVFLVDADAARLIIEHLRACFQVVQCHLVEAQRKVEL